MEPVLTVVAGVIRDADGRILICQRSREDTHALKWEFPGGKVEKGENPAEALVRELREELGIEASVGRELHRFRYRYGQRPPFQLMFFDVTEYAGTPVNRVFERMEWEEPGRLPDYDFLDADVSFVRKLGRRE
ncbi:MAG TPA: (deoxy)nucleoside triphosphate pyrophosphohydrolase [Bryobacteraceae bacterium]|jgi:8-oxo-dGTP diphosphatase|nr:(deoxy)nucleoside triphosphate pyrophosphohydrolase [Bryobacteraceae bacterium]